MDVAHSLRLKKEVIMGEMRVMGSTGDTKVMWDPQKDDEVKAAEAQFDILMGKKYKAYKVDKEGDKGSEITKFDPSAGKIIMAPPLAGG